MMHSLVSPVVCLSSPAPKVPPFQDPAPELRPTTPLLPFHGPPFHCWGPHSTSPSAPRSCPSSISAPPPSLAPPRPVHSLVPGRDSTVRKMVKPKATRCAKIPLPLRSQRVSLGSLVGAGTGPTSTVCMAGRAGPAHAPSCQNASSGFEIAGAAAAAERLLPRTPPAMRRITPTAPSGVWGGSASARQSTTGEGHRTAPGPVLKPTLLYFYVCKGSCLM